MKKSIKADLISLAHRILQLKDEASYSNMSKEARALYEKLTILAYAEELEQQGRAEKSLEAVEEELSELEPALRDTEIEKSVAEPEVIEEPELKKAKTPAEIAADNEALFSQVRASDKHRPDGTLFNTGEPLHEPVIEKIKDMVAEMPPEATAIDEMVEAIEPKNYQKNDMFEIGGEYAQTPIFEPVDTVVEEEKPKNLNDKLKSAIKIGLNDKIAFIKHLFNGSDTDYNRVLSQLSTFTATEDAQQFVQEMVKPDYNGWEGKEEYEERFMQVIENKFD